MSPLEAELRAIISASGPIPVARYMALCLGHPEHGYYMNRDPLGRAGDFITAPEISQMFGELLGLWAAAAWRQMGSPPTVQLIELGPGRGTMMADAVRAARAVPAFRSALQVHLVETSPALERRQRATLDACGVPVAWHRELTDIPEGDAIVLANEFFDALPIHQAVKGDRRVGMNAWSPSTKPAGSPLPRRRRPRRRLQRACRSASLRRPLPARSSNGDAPAKSARSPPASPSGGLR